MDETLATAVDHPAAVGTTGLGGLKFSKGHGTGNDFVLIADPNGALSLTPEQVAALCDRHRGIGADGLIRAVPSASLPEGRELLAPHPAAEWFMDYRNGDGSLSEMCGNGVRVFVHFLIAEGLVDLARRRIADHRHPRRRENRCPHRGRLRRRHGALGVHLPGRGHRPRHGFTGQRRRARSRQARRCL